jgi:hypothetical protein
MCHFLLSFARLLNFERKRPENYVPALVLLDGSIDEGKASAWMPTTSCCNACEQRELVVGTQATEVLRLFY